VFRVFLDCLGRFYSEVSVSLCRPVGCCREVGRRFVKNCGVVSVCFRLCVVLVQLSLFVSSEP
jgi:hypothetical protein